MSVRKVFCRVCREEKTYEYRGGRPRTKTCPTCDKGKKKGRAPFNAYGNQVFSGLPLPPVWRPTRNGSGNIGRWYRGLGGRRYFLTLYDHHGVFAVSLAPTGAPQAEFRHSGIVTRPENVSRAITWAQNVAEALIASYRLT